MHIRSPPPNVHTLSLSPAFLQGWYKLTVPVTRQSCYSLIGPPLGVKCVWLGEDFAVPVGCVGDVGYLCAFSYMKTSHFTTLRQTHSHFVLLWFVKLRHYLRADASTTKERWPQPLHFQQDMFCCCIVLHLILPRHLPQGKQNSMICIHSWGLTLLSYIFTFRKLDNR